MHKTDKIEKNFSPLAFLGRDIGNIKHNENKMMNHLDTISLFKLLMKFGSLEYCIMHSGIACFKNVKKINIIMN